MIREIDGICSRISASPDIFARMNSPDPTTRLNAALEGRYHIESELGEGGMATVYLAKDVKHNRNVALKVLKPELAAVVGAERFLAEIETTANLQHPHILPLFDSGEADSFLFYVMPYVEGETLRDKLDREHQLPVDDAVRIATNVAEALDYAHRQGVIHRDIKPANILLQDGKPVVSDFGIALAVGTAGQGRLTETGLSMGTPHYMSPEQATGDMNVGAATDTYALGAVLYEMLVGEPPYTGSTAQAILGKIIAGELATATKQRTSVPVNVDAAIRKALERVPADRFTGAQDFAKAVNDPGFRHGAVTGAGAGKGAGPWNRLTVTMTSVAMGALALAAWGWLSRPPTPEPGIVTRTRMRTDLNLDVDGAGERFAISPDGRFIVVGHREDDRPPALYLRRADGVEWQRLPNTEEARSPTISPDGLWVAFNLFTNPQQIMKVQITGGPALPIASGGSPHWGVGDVILYADGGVLYQVSGAGGTSEVLFASDTMNASAPHLLPNGEAVLFRSGGRIMILEKGTGEVRELVASGTSPRYVATGHLIYGHLDGTLLGVPFDLETLQVTGSPVTLLPELTVYGGGASQFAVSESGTLIYNVGQGVPLSRQLVEIDMGGAERPLPVLGQGSLGRPGYSPDGGTIAYRSGGSIGTYNVVTGATPRLQGNVRGSPVWSSSGDYLYFVRNSGGVSRRRSDLSREAEEISQDVAFSLGLDVNDAGSGGTLLVVRARTVERGFDLLLVRLSSDGVVFEDLLVADWNEGAARISPGGGWMAYDSDESGESRIYIRSFPAVGRAYPVSPELGTSPLWSPDGKALYYRSGSRFLMVDVATQPDVSISPPRLLFDGPAYEPDGDAFARTWDIHPDGSRFVTTKNLSTGANEHETFIVTNWFTELRERMGGN